MAVGFETGKAALALNPRPAFGFISTADAEVLPQPKPRTMREHFIVPSICSRDVGCAEWPDIRRFEHFPQLLDIADDAFNVHSVSNIQHERGHRQTEPHLDARL